MADTAVVAMTPHQAAQNIAADLFALPQLDNLRPARWGDDKRTAMIRTIEWAIENFQEGLTAERAGEYIVEHYNGQVDANDRLHQARSRLALGTWMLAQKDRLKAMLDGTAAPETVAEAVPWTRPLPSGTAVMIGRTGSLHGLGVKRADGTIWYVYLDQYGATGYGGHDAANVYICDSPEKARKQNGDYKGYVSFQALVPADPIEQARVERERAEREAKEKAEAEAAGPFAVGGIAKLKRGSQHYRLVFNYETVDDQLGGADMRRRYAGTPTWEVDPIDRDTRRSTANHSTQVQQSDLIMVAPAPVMSWPTIESMSENDPTDVEGLTKALRQARQDHLDDIAELSRRLAEWAVKAGYCATYDARMLDSAYGMKVPLAPRQSNHSIDMVDEYVIKIPRRIDVQAANLTAALDGAKTQASRFAPDLSNEIKDRLTRNLKNVREGLVVSRTGGVEAKPAT